MFLEINDLLDPREVAELRAIAGASRFIDGRASNPHSKVKNNMILADRDAHQRSSEMMVAALQRSEEFRNFAFPRTVARPLLTKYGAGGQHYGVHSDAAFMPMPDRDLRSDLSCTIFLSEPSDYDGGVLIVHFGAQKVEVKLPAGAAIVYPSTTLHEVTPVTRGERLIGLTFIESRIKDAWQREVFYELNEVVALEGLKMSYENYTRAQRVQAAIMRMWFEH